MLEWIAQLVGFIVILLVLWRYAVPPLRRAMAKQKELIRQQIEEAEEAARRREEAEQAYQNAVTEAQVEAAKIRDDARAEAQRIEEEMRQFAEREMERIRVRGEEQLVLQREQIVRELRTLIGGQALELAERIVREELSDDSRRGASVDRFLGELESMAGSGAPSGKGEG
jgi:ATP synthase F0 subunit b